MSSFTSKLSEFQANQQTKLAIFCTSQTKAQQKLKMNKQIIVLIALFAMVACAMANQYEQHYEPEEKKFIQLPALKLKLGMDKLTFKLPNLMSLFQTQKEHHYQPQQYY